MILNEIQKKTIYHMAINEAVTFGGVAVGMDRRYQVTRETERTYKIEIYDLSIREAVEYVVSPEGVIETIEIY